MYRIICLSVILFLAGCQAHSGTAKNINPHQKSPNEVLNTQGVSEYAGSVKEVIEPRIQNRASYHGKACIIEIIQPSGQKPEGMNANGGDPDLCSAGLAALRSSIVDNSFPNKPRGLPERIPVEIRL